MGWCFFSMYFAFPMVTKCRSFFTTIKMTTPRITFFRKLPDEVYLAFSGGIDSVVLLHKLLSANKKVTLLNINHGTPFSEIEAEFTRDAFMRYGVDCMLYYSIDEKDPKCSLEAHWSSERNRIYQSQDKLVVTGHHLDDAVEWYLMSSLQGCSKLLAYSNRNVARPMLVTPKQRILEYANHHKLEYLTDPTNNDTSFNLRNKVRHSLLPAVLETFPGIHTTVRKMILNREKDSHDKIQSHTT